MNVSSINILITNELFYFYYTYFAKNKEIKLLFSEVLFFIIEQKKVLTNLAKPFFNTTKQNETNRISNTFLPRITNALR